MRNEDPQHTEKSQSVHASQGTIFTLRGQQFFGVCVKRKNDKQIFFGLGLVQVDIIRGTGEYRD
jgi:hypothetical protein